MDHDLNSNRPVPKPRRNVIVGNSTPTKTDYVNVQFNNKKNNNQDQVDSVATVYKPLIDEIDRLKLAEAAEIKTTPRPVPAPRRAGDYAKDTYINVQISKGAVSKPLKPAPSIPDRVVNDTSKDTNTSCGKLPKTSTAVHTAPNDTSIFYDESPPSPPSRTGSGRDKNKRRSFSTGSTHSGDSHDSIPKYKTSSPSDILKSIGATSKLLSDSITERVSAKSKDAKHKIDKNLRKSKDKFGTWSSEKQKTATETLKNMREKITLRGTRKSMSMECEGERPKTMPVNDEILSSISFNSPLNNKTNNVEDLSTAESCYQIPKNQRYLDTPSPVASEKSAKIKPERPPPPYEQVFRTQSRLSVTDSDSSLSLSSASLTFERNVPMTQSMFSPVGSRHNMPPKGKSFFTKNKSESNIFHLSSMQEEDRPHEIVPSPISSSNDRLSQNFPPPTCPAPILNQDELYGKLKPVIPNRPDRHKKKKSVEDQRFSIASNRATIDLNERQLPDEIDERAMKIFSRSVATPSSAAATVYSNRSESWSFYDATNNDRSTNSSPEPVYANNDEHVYGKLCEMDSTLDERFLLKPQMRPSADTKADRSSHLVAPNRFKHDDDGDEVVTLRSQSEIVAEFDPLLNLESMTEPGVDKNSKLLILENLLNQETYGTTEANIYDDSASVSTYSDEDNTSEHSNVPTPPERTDSLNINTDNEKPSTSDANKVMIIHQNMSLRSDSVENLVDEAIIAPFLSRTEEPTPADDGPVDLSRSEQLSRSNWFIAEAEESDYTKPQKTDNVNRNDHKNIDKISKTIPKLNIDRAVDTEPPPPYSESMKPEPMEKKQRQPEEAILQPLPPTKSSSTASMKNIFSSVYKKTVNLRRKDSVKQETRVVIEMVPKPVLSQRYITHEGHLLRFPSGVVEDMLKELSARMGVLREKRFSTYLDPQFKQLKEQFLLEFITTIQCVDKHKISSNADMYCFEITTALPKNQAQHQQSISNPNIIISSEATGNKKTQRVCHVYGVAKRSDRNLWMQKLIESMTECFPAKFACEYTRAGWCYVKNSTTSPWSGAWILLSGRKLLFYSCNDQNLETMDLRKARCMVLKEPEESTNNLHIEGGPILMIDCPPYTEYIIMNCPRETKIWRHIIKESAHNNGTTLRRQQLTKDNVPVIIDKCINFIYTHGSMSEGIYRKSGAEAAIQKLLSGFREDAFSVKLTRTEFTEHDVANVLKRFMRGLTELLLEKYAEAFICVVKIKPIAEKIAAYKELLKRLSLIEFQTLKKLLGHLNFIQSQSARNKMGVQNLSLLWGVTLLRRNRQDDMQFYEDDAFVIGDLIMLYKHLFPVTEQEVQNEQIMLTFLHKYHAAAENLSDTVKQSGDLKVWITLDPNPENITEEKRQINVAVNPLKTVEDICKELASQIKPRIEAHNLSLMEVILDGELQRPMHYTENVLDTIIRWTNWPDVDCKKNYLKLTKNDFIEQLDRSMRFNRGSVIPNGELKFADNKTKAAKQFNLELVEGKIVVIKKEKNNTTIIKEIYLTTTMAYIGVEKKRDQSSRWAITLIENSFKKRTRDTPFIGHIIAGANLNDQIVWFSNIWYSLYKNKILPNPQMIIT